MGEEAAVKNDGQFRYNWLVFGDLNGFFGVMFDNITTLAFLAVILTNIFGMSDSVVYGKIFPGTAFGVLLGDMAFTWLAFRQAKLQQKDITAMPLGIDTPSTIGIAFSILGPAFIAYKNSGLSVDEATMKTWYVGMASMVYCGLFKVVCSFFGNWLSKVIPQAGLMGSLAGVGLALLAVVPVLEIMNAPIVGLIALGIVFYNMVAKIKLPFSLPGILTAIVVGTIVYYILGPLGLAGQEFQWPHFNGARFCLPLPTLGFINGAADAANYLPVIIPFAILVVVGGINVTESARLAGDDYKTNQILLIDAFSTIISGLCGSVAQTTAYLGQPAYKKMGSRAGYTLFTGIFVGLCGMLGIMQFVVDAIPTAALAPTICFVGIEIAVQAFASCSPVYYPAVTFAFIPNIARLMAIKGNYSDPGVFDTLVSDLAAHPERYLNEKLIVPALGNGFILTAMLWGAFFSFMIDKKLRHSSVILVILALLSFFGVIHSVNPAGFMYLPWNLPSAVLQAVPYQFSLGYLILALMIFLLSFTKESHMSSAEDE
ncbi:MAG: hypothetical protein K6A35_00920 [bacterium]|nr:hypothetical protein [bacterium]